MQRTLGQDAARVPRRWDFLRRSLWPLPVMNLLSRLNKALLTRALPGRFLVKRGPAAGHAVYLTFDDGPDPVHTPSVLDLLAEHQARATFFLIGNRIDANASLVERMVDAGHCVGNHSWSHPQFYALDLDAQLSEIDRTDAVLQRYTGRPTAPFRPPRGDVPIRMLLALARRRSRIVHWSRNSMDYTRAPVPELLGRMRDAPPVPGDIVLMHDDGPAAVAMLPELLADGRGRGLHFAALPQDLH